MQPPKYKAGDTIYFTYDLPEGISRVDPDTGEIVTVSEVYPATITGVATTVPTDIFYDPHVPHISGFKGTWTHLYAIRLDWAEIEQLSLPCLLSPYPKYGKRLTDVIFQRQITEERIEF